MMMKELIIQQINFRTCYRFLLLNAAIIIASFIIYPLNLIPQEALQLLSSTLALFLNLYADLGYIKYSFIQDERRFRKIVIAAICLSLLHSLLVPLNAIINIDSTKYAIYLGIIMSLSTLLFYFAFGLIKNDEIEFFKKLSKLNLCLPVLSFLALLLFILKLTSFILLVPILLAALITLISIWYWQIKLFKHLSIKYLENAKNEFRYI